jgi:hypothetical protein
MRFSGRGRQPPALRYDTDAARLARARLGPDDDLDGEVI